MSDTKTDKKKISIFSTIRRALHYLVRPELDIRHRVINITLLGAAISLIPSFFTIIVLGTGYEGLLLEGIALVLLLLFLWLVNLFPSSSWPIVGASVTINNIIFPIMYFYCGGRTTGMLIWMLLGTVIAVVLINGWGTYVHLALNIVSFTVCMWIENGHPDLVSYLASDEAEMMDILIAYALVALIIGLLFKYQARLYMRQCKIIEDKDAKLEEVNRELEKASAAKSAFLANMSHEIRTPINAVLGMDEMILRDCDDKRILQYASDIDTAGKQLLSIINDVLDISKIESGKMEINEEQYKSFSLINDCYNLIIGRARNKNLSLSITNNPAFPSLITGDVVRIRQIILNLLSNAVKYTEEGEVVFKFDFERLEDGRIVLIAAVKDTGIGISKEKQGDLFKKFSRIDVSAHRNVEGTGLGLAITKQMVEIMGGTIEVESEIGKGSVFTVRIPQSVNSWEPMGKFDVTDLHRDDVKKTYRQMFTARKASLLVVDDVLVNLNVVKLLLRDTQIQMDLVESGEAAIDCIKSKHYDLVLMDHMMPEMDGIQTLHKVREMKDNENCNVPMIALTANALTGVDRMCLDEGFCGYLAKPIKAQELEEMLLKFLPKDLVNIM